MSIAETILSELKREGVSTARLLAAVPAEQSGWTPHPKSMSIGALAWHIARIPKRVIHLLDEKVFDLEKARAEYTAGEGDVVQEYQKNVAELESVIAGLDDAAMMAPFTMVFKGETVNRLPVAGMIRTIALNHTYHHRGQLTVYLRLLDVPVPAMYGRSADEHPFG
jgi:uncharacterized damage-inducible protein DinB